MIEFKAPEYGDPESKVIFFWIGAVITASTALILFLFLVVIFGVKALLLLPPLGVFLLFKSGYVKFKPKRKRTEAD